LGARRAQPDEEERPVGEDPEDERQSRAPRGAHGRSLRRRSLSRDASGPAGLDAGTVPPRDSLGRRGDAADMSLPGPRERSGEAPSGRLGPLLYAASAFASAFLIFVVQPMVAKRIVPWFGGVPAVWMLCLAFYQTALFAGYAYAHCLIRFVRPA